MKKTLKQVIAVAGAVGMLGCSLALAACGGKKVERRVVDFDNYAAESQELYDAHLGEFKKYYDQARAAKDVSERYALMAVAEAKMLESGVFMPSTTRGGRYAISRAVAHTGTPTLWGNDGDRLHYVVTTEKLIKAADRAELNKLWADSATSSEYLAAAKKYVTDKGYTIKKDYKTSFTQDPKTWDILATYEQPTAQALVQTYDGLVEYDVKGVMQPALAKAVPESKVVSEEDGIVSFTFEIKEGQVWVDQSGAKVADFKAEDFATGFQHMLDVSAGLEWLVDGTVVGVSEYLDDANKDFSKVGVTVDGNKVTYQVYDFAESYFLTMLSYSIFAPMSKTFYESKGGKLGKDFNATAESYTYGKTAADIAYCGPYLVNNFTSKNTIGYTKNDSWWNKDANDRTCDTITMTYAGGMSANDIYTEVTTGGKFDGSSLTNATTTTAKQATYEGANLFDTYSYITSTDATTFNGFININRYAFANEADESKCVSPQTPEDSERTRAAVQNQNFRLAFLMSIDRVNYNAIAVGAELAPNSLRNSYTPGNYVQLLKDTTIKINGTDKTYKAGTYYGEIMQAQLDADQIPVTVWKFNDKIGEYSSDGYDGWFSKENAKAYLDKALAELKKDGVKVDTEKNKIQIDYPYTNSDELYINRAQAIKQFVDDALGGYVQVNLVEGDDEDWEDAAYNPSMGYGMNYDFADMSGWGPDYGDPSTYLDTMLNMSNTMTKCIGLF